MLNRKLKIRIVGSIVVLILAFSGQAMADLTAEEAKKLDAEAKATADKFLAETKGAKELFDDAKGILVCPTIRKAGLGIGAERGHCVLAAGTPEHLYYVSTSLKAGLIIGAESHSMILLLNTDKALAKFTNRDREWEFGADVSIAVAKVGAGGDIDTTNLKKDVVSFIFGEKGLMGDVSWEGSRFKKLDVK